MNRLEPGARVAVVDAGMKKFLGYGVYEGDFFCPPLAELAAMVADGMPGYQHTAALIRSGDHPTIGKNPRMLLDNGNRVWGCECWWGPEDDFKENGWAEKYGAAESPA